MICCEKCFKDIEIQAVIQSINQIGTCELCGKRNVYIYNTDTNNELAEMFDDLLNIYTANEDLPRDYPRENINLLKDELCRRWNIFNIDNDLAYRAITGICYEKYLEHPEIFDAHIGILELNQKDYLEEHSIMKTFEWEDFVEGIKTKNRFHTEYINKEVFYSFCNYIKKTYKMGTIFYRARICKDETGYTVDQMGAPPVRYANAGRANPTGISCLYLADTDKTALNEIRAGVYDYVAIGKFVLKEDIEVVNLTIVDQISPFWGIDNTIHAVNKKHLQKIGIDIAKPLRRHDSILDYLPTQYISDFIKSKGFAGIEYKSTMNLGGYNLAIFDEKVFECTTVDIYDIRELTYGYEKL